MFKCNCLGGFHIFGERSKNFNLWLADSTEPAFAAKRTVSMSLQCDRMTGFLSP